MNIKRLATLIVMAVAAAAGAQSLKMSVTDTGGGTLRLGFPGTRYDSYALYVVSGAVDGGADYSNWSHTNFIANIAAGVATYDYALPAEFVSEGRYYRFFMRNAAYQRIEYVENTGVYESTSAYANTVSASDGKGVTPTRNTIVKGEVEYVEAASDRGTWNNIFGCSDSSFFQFGVHNSSAPYDWYTELRKLESGGNTFMGIVTPGDRYAFEYCVANMTVWNVSSSGAAVSVPLLSAGTTFDDMTTDKFTIFRCTKSTGAIYDRPFTGKIYSFEILENGIPIRNYVPVKRLADEKVGFYDLVNGDFKSSESSVEFIGGAAVAGDFITVQSATRRAAVGARPLNDGLAAYFTFDETMPVNHAVDATVTGLTLSGSGAASGETGAAKYGFGGCLDLARGYASVDGSERLAFDNGNNFTLVVWARADAACLYNGNWPAITGNGDWNNASSPGVVLGIDSEDASNVYPICNYSDRDSSSGRQRVNCGALASGEWTFYAISRTSDNKFRFWRSRSDGSLELVDERDAYGLRLVNSEPRKFYLGSSGDQSYATSYPFTGQIDEFALWTRGLQPADIERIYNSGKNVNGRPGKALGNLLNPGMTVEDIGDGKVRLDFAGNRDGDYALKLRYGASDGGNDYFAAEWSGSADVATVTPSMTSYEYTLPGAISAGYSYRFFLMKNASYQEIEYIENTNSTSQVNASAPSPIIDTGMTPTKNTAVECEIEIGTQAGWGYVFGCEPKAYDIANSKTNFFDFGVVGPSYNNWFVDRPYGGNYYPTFGSWSAGTRYGVEYCVTNARCWSVAGAELPVNQPVYDSVDDFPDSGGSAMGVVSLFRHTNQQSSRPFVGKMFWLKMLEGGEKSRDYVPAKATDGTVGMYDFISGTFFENSETRAGVTDFTAGPAVASGRLTVSSETFKKPSGTGDPVVARWIGGANGALDATSSWHCEDGAGATVAAVPQNFTTITIDAPSELFDVSEGSVFAYSNIVVGSAVALTGDLDWSGIELAKVSGSGSLDLAGHSLAVSARRNLTDALTVTDAAGDGELLLDVPDGLSVTNSALAFTGAATLVKKGAGTLVTIKTGQANSGGVRVDAGTLVTTNYINSAVLGEAGSKVEVGINATLRVENGKNGLEDHNLVLAGGTLYIRNSLLIGGRSFIGSLTQTNMNSTILVESTGGTDAHRDTEIANGSVWDLGNHKLTIRFVPGDTDLFIDTSSKLTVKNGHIDIPSVMSGATGGWFQLKGEFDAHDNVTVLYGMNTVRWQGAHHHSISNFINQIPHKNTSWNISGDSRMDIYGTYTPYPDVKTNVCGHLQMMHNSTIDLSGLANVTWSAVLDGKNIGMCPMEYDETRRGTIGPATVYIDLGARVIETETGLDRRMKIVSWDEVPRATDNYPNAAGVKFVEKNGRYSLYQASSGIYVMSGMRTVFK